MARGWESKGVDEQISAAEAKQEARVKQTHTAMDLERQQRRESLLLERTRLVREIQGAHNERYQAMLKRSLNHIETELAKLETDNQTPAQTK